MGRIIPMDAIVTDADSYAAIVGNDWLRKTKANIDYGINKLTLKWEDEILRVPTECQTMPHHITTIEVPDIEEDEDVEEETVEEEADEAIEELEEEYETEDDEKQQEQLYCNTQFITWERAQEIEQDLKENKLIENEYYYQYKEVEKGTFHVGDLNDEQRRMFQEFMNRHVNLFTWEPDDFGRTSVVKHGIDTGNVVPIKQRFYQTSYKNQLFIKEEIQRLLKAGLIVPSRSQWTSPVVVVEKKNGKKRLCVDYWKLNKVTKRDCYPLPRIDDMLETLSGSQWFSSLDLASGFWQVELDQKDQEKSTFITRFGTYEFTVMPFGLCNAPATFQRLMDTVLRDILWQFVVVYIDDINVRSKTFEEHLLHLEQVFSRLAQARLKLSPEKCFFFKDEIPFLGHVVSRHGIQTDPEKLRVIKEFPIPKDLTQLRGFIALASYYRKFVKNFSCIVEPLNRLLKKNTPFVWGNDQVDSFEYLKTCLMTPPILSYPNFEKPFILYTDASTFALGAILSQKNEDKKERVIAYASRTLGKHERNYGITELECLTVVWAIKHFHYYLHGQKFTVITDHAALRYLLNLSNPIGRLGRWLIKEQQAAIKRKSRYFVVIDEQLYKKNKSNPNRPLKVVKQDEIDDVLHHMHSDPLAGHFSLDEIYRKIKIQYYWPQMFEDVRNYVKTCDECQRRGKNRRAEPLHPIKIGQPFDRVGMDIVGPLPQTKDGNKYIVVATEYLTKWPEARAIPDAKATSVVSFFYEDIICRHGCPKEILTDRGTHFVNDMLNSLCNKFEVKHRLSTTYHPQTNGLVECFNRTLCETLAKFANENKNDWDLYVSTALFAYRTRKHNTTRYEPFYLMYGRETILPIEFKVATSAMLNIGNDEQEDLLNRVRMISGRMAEERLITQDRIYDQQQRQKQKYDKNIKEQYYKIGDLVLLYKSHLRERKKLEER
ncbi:KRAB-A domain-containing protein [Rhizophagus clarus]|uniref:KRAB-A domain-containing protein n=1 Tax=Rhizophagus clarus TaxID=94130 RepID=A0A8H3LDR4_9GLOM|nr:KRAB-A domain-containing protein [Rhizophagus clarus]